MTGRLNYWTRLVVASLLAAFIAPAFAAAQAPSRRIRFSNLDWTVKASDHAVGPGPNFFSDSGEDVWVDDRGRLHLRIAFRDGIWWSTEVICTCSPGYGTYAFRIPAETIRDFDANVVLGLFNWSDDGSDPATFVHREIDAEISFWGQQQNANNAQFVVQPYDLPGHMSRFKLDGKAPAQLTFTWLPDRVVFQAIATSAQPVSVFEFRGNVASPGGNPRINLWLLGGQAPLNGHDIHVVIDSFRFLKASR